MLLLEHIIGEAKILESDRTKLPDGVLCRVREPVCNVDQLNANKRMYGWDVWERVMGNKTLTEQMQNRALFGHAEHPATSQSDLQLVSHVIVEWTVDKNTNTVYQTFDVLDTPTGRIVDCMVKSCKPGVSTRAEGELTEEVDEQTKQKFQRVIAEKYKYITTDFTADPSTFGAMPIDVKRNVVETIRSAATRTEAKDGDKKFAGAILESMSCKDKAHCQKCGCCEAIKEATVQIVADPNQGLVNVGGDVGAVNINPSATGINPGGAVEVTVTSIPPDPAANAANAVPAVDPHDLEDEEDEDLENPEEEDEDEIGEAKINEISDLALAGLIAGFVSTIGYRAGKDLKKKIKEYLAKKKTRKTESKVNENNDPAFEDATHYVLKRRADKAAVDHLMHEYKMTEEKANEVLKRAKDTLTKEMQAAGFDKEAQAAVEDRITEDRITKEDARSQLEKDGIDFKADFHTLNSSDVDKIVVMAKKVGYRKPKSASGSTGRYFFSHLANLGKNESRINEDVEVFTKERGDLVDVQKLNIKKMLQAQIQDITDILGSPTYPEGDKRGDRKNVETTWVGEIDGMEFVVDAIKDDEGNAGVVVRADENEIVDKLANYLRLEKQWSQPATVGVPNESKSANGLLKEMTRLRIDTAVVKAERDRLVETVNGTSDKGLQLRVAIAKLQEMRNIENMEITALRNKLEEKATMASNLSSQVMTNADTAERLIKENRGLMKRIDELTVGNKKILEENKAKAEGVEKEEKKALVEQVNKAKTDATRAVIIEYANRQLRAFKSVHDNVRALLEGCMTIAEVDEVLNEFRDSQRRSALHSKPPKEVTVRVDESQGRDKGVRKRVGMAFESFGMK